MWTKPLITNNDFGLFERGYLISQANSCVPKFN